RLTIPCGRTSRRSRLPLPRSAVCSSSGASAATSHRSRTSLPLPDGFFRRSTRELVPYEPGKPVEEVQRELGLDRVVKLASNEGSFGPFPAALEAMARAALELNRYPDGGAWALRSALAERHAVRLDEVAVGR